MDMYSMKFLVNALVNGIYAGAVVAGYQPYTFHSAEDGGVYSLPPVTPNVVYAGYLKFEAGDAPEIACNGQITELQAVSMLTPVIFERIIPTNGVGSTFPVQFCGFRIIIPGFEVQPGQANGFLAWSDTPGDLFIQSDAGGYILYE